MQICFDRDWEFRMCVKDLTCLWNSVLWKHRSQERSPAKRFHSKDVRVPSLRCPNVPFRDEGEGPQSSQPSKPRALFHVNQSQFLKEMHSSSPEGSWNLHLSSSSGFVFSDIGERTIEINLPFILFRKWTSLENRRIVVCMWKRDPNAGVLCTSQFLGLSRIYEPVPSLT